MNSIYVNLFASRYWTIKHLRIPIRRFRICSWQNFWKKTFQKIRKMVDRKLPKCVFAWVTKFNKKWQTAEKSKTSKERLTFNRPDLIFRFLLKESSIIVVAFAIAAVVVVKAFLCFAVLTLTLTLTLMFKVQFRSVQLHQKRRFDFESSPCLILTYFYFFVLILPKKLICSS